MASVTYARVVIELPAPAPTTTALTWRERRLYRHGASHQMLSGGLHYFRVHPRLWRDRIRRLADLGLNTIDTYVPWNFHQPREHEAPSFDGWHDIEQFIRTVGEEGLDVVVRPGPYICAEWSNGGLPSWLTGRDVALRSSDPAFTGAVGHWFDELIPRIATLQAGAGGPVVAVQVENEFGSFGDDHAYLEWNRTALTERGIRELLFTADGPTELMLDGGTLPDTLTAVTLGSKPQAARRLLAQRRPDEPFIVAEYWNGWFDHWGAHHHTTSAAESAAELDTLLAAGASVNLYMFHGGTNFGLTSGANDKGVYQPTITSYDYDAPLDEAGNPTAKYHAFREVISRYHDVPGPPPSAASPAPQFETPLRAPVSLLEAPRRWGVWQYHESLPTFDELDPAPRMALLRTRLRGSGPGVLCFGEIRDRARVFLDGRPVGTLQREHHERAIGLGRAVGELTVLLEDLGRVNYGPRLGEPKGIIGGATLDGEPVTGWDILPIDLDTVPVPEEAGEPLDGPIAGPVLVRAGFSLDEPADLHLDTGGWGKGVAWINGFPLGRYWRRGPQRTLYVPGPALRAGENELAVFETDVLVDPVARFVPGPLLGHTDS